MRISENWPEVLALTCYSRAESVERGKYRGNNAIGDRRLGIACFRQQGRLPKAAAVRPNWRWINDDRTLSINFDPGSKYAYSGEGIDFLQLVVETVTKSPMPDVMMSHIFERFEMTLQHGSGRAALRATMPTVINEWGRPIILRSCAACSQFCRANK